MKIKQIIIAGTMLLALMFSSCIGDDFINDRVDPVLRIISTIDTIGFGEDYQFQAQYFNNVGKPGTVAVSWESSDQSIISINTAGLATGLATGRADIRAEATTEEGEIVSTEISVVVGAATVESAAFRVAVFGTTTSYDLEGTATWEETATGSILKIGEDFVADDRLPQLVLYLTNNPNSTSGALEIAEVKIFSGAISYPLDGVNINDYSHILYFCKPFNVKVGDGAFSD